jgi:hypothetical protein
MIYILLLAIQSLAIASYYMYTNLTAKIKTEQRARIRMALRIKILEASWQNQENLKTQLQELQSKVSAMQMRLR